MALSKEQKGAGFSVAPYVFELVGGYLQQLYARPIRTESITSAVTSLLGNATSQCLYGGGAFDKDSAMAFALFGLVFGGALPHTFHKLLDSMVRRKPLHGKFLRFLIERLLFTPAFLLLRLYVISIFEGKSHQAACRSVLRSYPTLLQANWYGLSIFQFYGLNFVSPMLRPLYASVVEYFWTIFLAKTRKEIEQRKQR